MSKKRTSPDSSNDEQTNEGSDSVFQQDNIAKRARLTSPSDTMLQDLPMELIECILVKVVAMEVNGMKLAKSVWKEKADLVISQLRTVCSQWNSILTTNFFRNELHRTLDALETVHMEILQKSPIFLPPGTLMVRQVITMKDQVFMLCKSDGQDVHAFNLRFLHPEPFFVLRVITLKDQVFMLCKTAGQDHYAFNVYDRNNMAELKDVVPLPGTYPPSIAVCYVSNCVYALCRETSNRDVISIQRITKDDEHQFTVSPVISDMWMPHPTLSVTANGSLILSRWQSSEQLAVIGRYDANGSLQHEIRLSSGILEPYEIIPKSNGNLVLVSANDQWQTTLTEIDMDGTLVRQYQSSIEASNSVCYADMYGRILIADRLNRMELLDSEFNLMESNGPELDEDKLIYCCGMNYDSERNEVIGLTIVQDDDSVNGVLATCIFHFTEE